MNGERKEPKISDERIAEIAEGSPMTEAEIKIFANDEDLREILLAVMRDVEARTIIPPSPSKH